MTALYGSQSNLSANYIDGSDEGISISELLSPDRLGWRVTKTPVMSTAMGQLVDSHQEIVRHNGDGSMIPLGLVGKDRPAHQNHDVLDFWSTMAVQAGVDLSVTRWGHLDGGQICWFQADVNGDIYEPVNGDPVHRQLRGVWSPISRKAMVGAGTCFQQSCNNQFPMVLDELKKHGLFKFKVTQNIDNRKSNWLEFHNQTGQSWDHFKEFADYLVSQSMSVGRFQRFLDAALPVDLTLEDKRGTAPTIQKREDLTTCFEDSQGVGKWRAFNAITRYGTHYAPMRGGSEQDQQARRSFKQLEAPVNGEQRQLVHVLRTI
jgi:hypothetical protein